MSDDVGPFILKAKFGRCVNTFEYLLANNIVITAPLLGCIFRSLMGRILVGNRNEAQSSGGAVSILVVISST